jgi:adenylyl-sulfate kinase
MRRGHVIWLFGLSGAGKTTLGRLLATALRARQVPVLEIDGDIVRSGLCKGLGFSDEDRTENLRRSAEVAALAIDSGLWVVAAFITPSESQRALIARIIGRDSLSLAFLDASLDVCAARDVKGLYARAKGGQLPQMTGVSSAFEVPQEPDLTLHTGEVSTQACIAQLLDFAEPRINPR